MVRSGQAKAKKKRKQGQKGEFEYKRIERKQTDREDRGGQVGRLVYLPVLHIVSSRLVSSHLVTCCTIRLRQQGEGKGQAGVR